MSTNDYNTKKLEELLEKYTFQVENETSG